MGLSSLPAPGEGVLCIILVNTAQSISIFKGIICFILQIMGIHISSSSSESESVQTSSGPYDLHITSSSSSDTLVEQLHRRIPSIRFSSCCDVSGLHDCRVCLNQFEPDSELNQLCCGHFFHKECLEKWLDYCNITCPLCRTPLISETDHQLDDDDDDQTYP